MMFRQRTSLIDPHVVDVPPLEVRTVTLGINAGDLASRNLQQLCESLYARVLEKSQPFIAACRGVAAEYGVPILQRRVSITPIDRLAESFGGEDLVNIARTLDGAAANAHVDQISGYSIRAQYGISRGAQQMIAALPNVLKQTERVLAAVEAASTTAGINIDALELLGRKVKETAEATADRGGIGAAKLAVLANVPLEGPPIAGACSGDGWGDLVVHVHASAIGPIRHAIKRRLEVDPNANLQTLAGDIQAATFQAARAADLVGKEIAQRIQAQSGRVDVSLAPTVRAGQTIAELLQQLGVAAFGTPGSAAALALICQALRMGGAFAAAESAASVSILLPILRDAGLVSATEAGSLALEHLALLSAVGGQGLDLVPVPGDTSAATLSSLMADQLATAVFSGRTTVVRLVPVPGRKAGERVSFGRDLGDATVLAVPSTDGSQFIQRGGRIPGSRGGV